MRYPLLRVNYTIMTQLQAMFPMPVNRQGAYDCESDCDGGMEEPRAGKVLGCAAASGPIHLTAVQRAVARQKIMSYPLQQVRYPCKRKG